MSGLLPKPQPWAQRELQKVHPSSSINNRLPGDGIASQGDSGNNTRKLTQWTIIAERTGVQNTKERLKSFWTTLGITSALSAALTYPAVTAPTVSKHSTDAHSGSVDDPLFVSYVLLNTLSLILSFVVVIISVMLLAEVDLVLTDEDLETFIHRYQFLFLALTGIFGFSILTIIASVIVAGFYHHSRGTAIAAAAICMCGTVFVAVVAAWVSLWTRQRLRVHISEANARLRAVVAKLLRGPGVAATPPAARDEEPVAAVADNDPRRKPIL